MHSYDFNPTSCEVMPRKFDYGDIARELKMKEMDIDAKQVPLLWMAQNVAMQTSTHFIKILRRNSNDLPGTVYI